jgi:tRNA(fMet)-specific endonuclease VapC
LNFILAEFSGETRLGHNRQLKQKRKQIDLADLFIAATAVAYELSLATLNRKHFDRIDTLTIIE